MAFLWHFGWNFCVCHASVSCMTNPNVSLVSGGLRLGSKVYACVRCSRLASPATKRLRRFDTQRHNSISPSTPPFPHFMTFTK